jgi:GNAT superfamily N-acetyltransferase
MIVEVVEATVTRELRRAVLRPTWRVGAPMPGDDEPAAVHLAARGEDATVVGACVLLPRPYPNRVDGACAWQLRGMATAAAARGRGAGTLLIAAAVGEVRARGGRLLWCEARARAVAFYGRNGFRDEGELFLHPETGTPHQLMWRELSTASSASTG